MFSSAKSLIVLSCYAILSQISVADSSWTCSELETTTDTYYRMLPAYIAKAIPNDDMSLLIENLSGHCFRNINIRTAFSYLDSDNSQIKASIQVEFLNKRSGFCTEHFQVSTAFTDHYDFYIRHGNKTIEIEFTDLAEVIDIHMNGLRFFTYCADAWTLLSSSFETMFLWLGGSGYTSNHIPVFGSRPTDYQ